MKTLAPLLAQLADDLAPCKFNMNPSSRDVLIVMGAALVVGLLALCWAVFLRKKKRRHHRPDGPHRSGPLAGPPRVPGISPATGPSNPVPNSVRHDKSRRRRRRKDRRRNPTLAETGGLPPIRREGQSEPPA